MVNYKSHTVVIIACWLIFGISSLDIVSHFFIEGKQIIPEIYRGLERKGTIKTIVCPEDNDVVDCVDFYKQPAFDDPQIKVSEVDPGLFLDETEMTDDELRRLGLYQNWRKYGKCPNGTIPIRRSLNHKSYRKKGLPNGDPPEEHEYAIVQRDFKAHYGGRAILNLWNPHVESNEFSLAQMWVSGGNDRSVNLEVLEAGWIVNPAQYIDSQTRFFIHWTKDNYYFTGCYDVNCPGFVHVNKGFTIGGPISGISTYNDTDYYMRLAIYKDDKKGDWWLNVHGKKVGYWPRNLFKNLKDSSDSVHWGGEITNYNAHGRHTITEMGSGHFAYESRTRASYVGKLAIRNEQLNWVKVPNNELKIHVTRPECYTATIRNQTKQLGTHFYYGGPGGNSRFCK